MSRRALAAVAAIGSLLIATSCDAGGGDGDRRDEVQAPAHEAQGEESPLACRPAPRVAIATLSRGLRQEGWLRGAMYVEAPEEQRNAQGWPAWYVAAPIAGSVGVWATGELGEGPIAAINAPSARATVWGTGAHPESQAWRLYARLSRRQAARAAVACVASG